MLPCGMAIKQHCTGLSLHSELQLKGAYVAANGRIKGMLLFLRGID